MQNQEDDKTKVKANFLNYDCKNKYQQKRKIYLDEAEFFANFSQFLSKNTEILHIFIKLYEILDLYMQIWKEKIVHQTVDLQDVFVGA